VTTKVWAYSESSGPASEVAAAAKKIADSCGGESVCLELDELRTQVGGCHSKLLLRSEGRLGDSVETAGAAIGEAAASSVPDLILVAATRRGREVGSMLSVKLGRPCIGESFNLRLDGSSLKGDRSVYAGRVVATVSCELPAVAVVKLGAYEPSVEDGVQVVEERVGLPKARVITTGTSKKDAAKVDLRTAKVIVSGGRGFKRREDLDLLVKLAGALGGTIGCSRPLSSDLGWLGEEYHIGLTGVNVHPNLYLAVGISGQLQHVAGIKDSRVIAAINSDKDAPIFQASDYGVVGDLYQVIPAMLRLISGQA